MFVLACVGLFYELDSLAISGIFAYFFKISYNNYCKDNNNKIYFILGKKSILVLFIFKPVGLKISIFFKPIVLKYVK